MFHIRPAIPSMFLWQIDNFKFRFVDIDLYNNTYIDIIYSFDKFDNISAIFVTEMVDTVLVRISVIVAFGTSDPSVLSR